MPRRLLPLLCLALALPAAAADLGRIRPDEVAFFVQDLRSGKVLAEHRADVPLNPASTMKLVTAYAALLARTETQLPPRRRPAARQPARR